MYCPNFYWNLGRTCVQSRGADVDFRGSDILSLLVGELSDDDLFDVSKDDTYKPDKGKGNTWIFTEESWESI